MSVYDKARELADAILASEESLRMADAMASAEKGRVPEEELNKAIEDYNALINEALDIVRMSIGADKGCENRCGVCKGGISNGPIFTDDGAILAHKK